VTKSDINLERNSREARGLGSEKEWKPEKRTGCGRQEESPAGVLKKEAVVKTKGMTKERSFRTRTPRLPKRRKETEKGRFPSRVSTPRCDSWAKPFKGLQVRGGAHRT